MSEKSETVWLTCKDIAERSGYARSIIQKYLKDGIIKSTIVEHNRGIGYMRIIKEEDYIEWINSWPEEKASKIGRPRKPQKKKKSDGAVPVRNGRWIADESTYTDGFVQCSVCRTTYYAEDLYCVGEKAQSELPNYCPHCGAKMTDGEE